MLPWRLLLLLLLLLVPPYQSKALCLLFSHLKLLLGRLSSKIMQKIKKRKLPLTSIPCHICSMPVWTKTQERTDRRKQLRVKGKTNQLFLALPRHASIYQTKCFSPSLMGTPGSASLIYANKGGTRPHNSFTMTWSPLGCFNTGVQHQHFLLRGVTGWLHHAWTPQVLHLLGSAFPFSLKLLYSDSLQIYHGHLRHF